MKKIDVTCMTLVQQGKPWPFSVMPNSKEMLRYLEKNESIVTWFQPREGKLTDQVLVTDASRCDFGVTHACLNRCPPSAWAATTSR